MKTTPAALRKLPLPPVIGCTQLPCSKAPVAGSNEAQYMNVNFRSPAGSFLSQEEFALESRHPTKSSLPLATNCDEDA
jgi:hypothetical protein